jgi:phage-related protein
MFLPRL